MNTNNKILKKDIEEIEKRMRTISDNGITSQQVTQIVQSQTSQLSSSINSLQADVTQTQSDVAILQTDVTENKTSINTLQTDVSTTQSNIATLQSDVSDNKSDISTLQTDVTQNQASIASVQSDVSSLQQQVDTNTQGMTIVEEEIANNTTQIANNSAQLYTLNNLTTETSTKLNTLQNSLSEVAYSGNYNDLLSLPSDADFANFGLTQTKEQYCFVSNQKFNANGETAPIYLYVEPNEVVVGKITFYIAATSAATNCTSHLYLNKTQRLSGTAACQVTANGWVQHTINFKFIPEKICNSLMIKIVTSKPTTCSLREVTLDIYSGKNPMILSKTNKNQVALVGNLCWISTSEFTGTNKYITVKKFNTDFTDKSQITFTEQIIGQPLAFEKFCLINDDGYCTYLGRDASHEEYYYENTDMSFTDTFSTETGKLYACSPLPFTCSIAGTNLASTYPLYANLVLYDNGENEYLPVITKLNSLYEYKLKYNGEDIPAGYFIDIQAVLPLMDTYASQDKFFGYVMVRRDGQCFFFPDFDSSYYIKLGFGRRPMAYYSAAGITIILGGNNFCKRIELKKNSSNYWVVYQKFTYNGIDNLRLINNDEFLLAEKGDLMFFDDKQKYFFQTIDIDTITYETNNT